MLPSGTAQPTNPVPVTHGFVRCPTAIPGPAPFIENSQVLKRVVTLTGEEMSPDREYLLKFKVSRMKSPSVPRPKSANGAKRLYIDVYSWPSDSPDRNSKALRIFEILRAAISYL